jgi:hypothetical protein
MPGKPRGEMDGDLVAKGDKAGEKEGDMADAEESISCDIGDRGVVFWGIP